MRLPRLALALTFLALLPGLSPAAGPHAAPAPAISADTALARLREGNQRFVAGQLQHPAQTAARRQELTRGQHPFAVILTCADSRVSPEIIFDQGLGDLFVIRNAGNLSDDHVLGSIEYAVEHLHTPLVIVLGHSQCGAVAATVGGGEAHGHIRSVVASLQPAVAMAKKKPGDPVENAVRINARLTAAAIGQADPILSPRTKAGQVRVLAARYDLTTGQVEIFP